MLNRIFRLWPQTLLLALLIAVQAAAPVSALAAQKICRDAFELAVADLDSAEKRLTAELEEPEKTVSELRIKLSDMKIVRYLGKGYSGVVYEVKLGRRSLALKLFYSTRPTIPTLDSIVIQKNLASLGMAPTIHAYLDTRQTQLFYHLNLDDFEQTGHFTGPGDVHSGILMDLVTHETLKTRASRKKISVSPAEKARLKMQAIRYMEVLYELSIIPIDLDAVVTRDSEGLPHLMLIDLSFYERGRDEHGINERLLMAMIDDHYDDRAGSATPDLWERLRNYLH